MLDGADDILLEIANELDEELMGCQRSRGLTIDHLATAEFPLRANGYDVLIVHPNVDQPALYDAIQSACQPTLILTSSYFKRQDLEMLIGYRPNLEYGSFMDAQAIDKFVKGMQQTI